MQLPSIERLREVLAYDPETGKLTWRVVPHYNARVSIGEEAGSKSSRGYIQIVVDGVLMRAHRVIFAMVTGHWPTVDIDHEDRNKTNNRWINLREANDSQNRANSKVSKNNSIGLKGVSQSGSAFKASIKFNGRQIYLGTYPTAQMAHDAYAKKAAELFGKFARAA